MWKAVTVLVLLLLVLLFGAQNLHQVRINLPLAGAFEIRTVFLLMLCFFLGFACASFIWIARQLRRH